MEQLVIDVGMQGDAHLATAREDVDGVVVVLADDHAVRRGWLRQLVDLVAQCGDVLTRFAQGVGELLVLTDRGGELPSTLRDLLLARVTELAEPTQEFLRVAAAAGQRVDPALLAAAAALDEAALYVATAEDQDAARAEVGAVLDRLFGSLA